MRHGLSTFLAVTTVMILAACTRGDASPEPAKPAPAAAQPDLAAVHADAPGIAWFKGDVDAAFKAAQAGGKPVLLY